MSDDSDGEACGIVGCLTNTWGEQFEMLPPGGCLRIVASPLSVLLYCVFVILSY